MTVTELIEKLKELDSNLTVEILDNDGNNSREVGDVTTDEVTRGIALPTPRVYKVVVLSSGMEGL